MASACQEGPVRFLRLRTWVKALLSAAALTALLLKVDILWVVLGGTLLSVALLR